MKAITNVKFLQENFCFLYCIYVILLRLLYFPVLSQSPIIKYYHSEMKIVLGNHKQQTKPSLYQYFTI